jgi:hypothetical protein
MLQRATFTPEGGIPAYGTDAWSKEQALIEPYTDAFAPTRDVELKPPHASPLPLQRHGLRRAKARFCQQEG